MFVFGRRARRAAQVGLRSGVVFAALLGAGMVAPVGAVAAVGGDVDLSVGAGIVADAFGNFLVGEDVLFGFDVGNAGPDVATDVVVTVTLPPELEVVSWNGVAGGDCVTAPQSVTCTFVTLPVGWATGDGLLRATAPVSGLLARSSVTTTSNDTDPSNDARDGLVYAATVPTADVSASGVFVEGGTAVASLLTTVGVPTQIGLLAWNDGPQRAQDVVLSSTIPADWRVDGLVGVESGDPTVVLPQCTVTGQSIECRVSALPPQSGVLVRIAATPVAAGSGTVPVSVTAATADPDPATFPGLRYVVSASQADLSVSLVRRFTSPAVEEEPVEYIATVSNAGPLATRNAMLTFSATPPLTIVSADFRGLPCDVLNGESTCTIGIVEPGISQTVRVVAQADRPIEGASVSATVESELVDVATLDNTASATVNVVTGSADLRIDVIGPIRPIVAGEPQAVTVDVVSSGPNIAKGVTVDVDAGPGTSVSSIAGDGWSCQPVARGARCTRDQVNPGFTPAPRITASVIADGTAATAELLGRVSAMTADAVTTNDTDGFSVPVLASGTADLRLRSVASGGDVTVGTPFRIDAIVEQFGPAVAARDVVTTFNVPSEYQVTSVQPPSPAWSCAVTTGLVTCSAAERPIFDRSVIVVTLVPVRSGPGGAIRVDVVSAGPDPLPSNNSLVFPARNLFETRPDLAVSIAAPSVVELGGAIERVEVTVANDAYAAAANDLSVTLTLPEQFEIMTAPLTPCSFTTTTVTCPYGFLNRGSSMTFGVDVLAVAPVANGAFVATATSAAADADPVDNTATSPVTVPVVLPPAAPGRPVAQPLSRAAALTFVPPAGAANVFDYVVQYSSNGGRTWTTFADGVQADTAVVVSGLVNGTRYVFRVAAVNLGGQGPWSPVSNAVTPVPPPRAPTNVRAAESRGVVSLTWRAPDPSGRLPVTDYLIQYSRNGGSWTAIEDATSTATSARFVGLPAGRYRFRVAAMSAAGPGTYSAESNQITIRTVS